MYRAVIATILVTTVLAHSVHPLVQENTHEQLADLNYDEVLKLSQKFQEALFASANSRTMISRMQEVFFPSANYRFWQADNIEIIDIEVCLKIYGIPSNHSCITTGAHRQESCTQCVVFRWTNSYFVNLIDIHQMYSFDAMSTSILFGSVAHEHKGSRLIKIMLNASCEGTCPFIEKSTTKQALIQFLSWVKAYAKSQGTPTSLEEKDQGYVTRKYDYTAVDLLLFDKKSDFVFKTILTCFILCNVLAMYVLLKYAKTINTKLNETTIHNDYKANFTKGAVIFAAIVSPIYIIGSTFINENRLDIRLSSLCDKAINYYGCVPTSDYPLVHKKQLMSILACGILKILTVLLYAVYSVYIVKSSRQSGIVFQHHYLKWIEVYLMWSVLMGVHIVIGLASVPLLIFTILIPMYMIFYVSCVIIIMATVILPIAAIFHFISLAKDRTTKRVHLTLAALESAFVYILVSGITATLLILNYLFLAGGASLNGVKGVLFSLLPSVMISVVVLIMKARLSNKTNVRALLEEQEILLHA